MPFGPASAVAAVMRNAEARAVVEQYAPGALDSPLLEYLPAMTLGAITSGGLFAGEQPPDLDGMWHELQSIQASEVEALPPKRPAKPKADYETADTRPGTATLRAVAPVERWGLSELVFDGPSHGNPFTDVQISATFSGPQSEVIRVNGFYDGDGVYRIRFCPPTIGRWRFSTSSNGRSLSGITGAFEVRAPDPGNRGPVAVADRFHFAYADGSPHLPVGTTLYAWTHQPERLRQQTIETLAQTAFTKVRMCVMPKSYLFNSAEPELYPFERNADGSWSFDRPNPAFFQRLEEGILALSALGIEADTILFHAYDRWGFSTMPAWADDLYVRYVVRRLAAYRNVWWSLANEYDLLPGKSAADWERIAFLINQEDHVGHLASIHNCFAFYNYSRPWVTHCSIQRVDLYRTSENVDSWRQEWQKPVVVDECAYEGDIDQGWGNISGEEMVRRAWEGAVRGGYVNHGETYVNDAEELWWSKGGRLVGTSPARFAFLLELIRQAPSGHWDPLPSDWDARWGGSVDHRVVYFGFERPSFRWISTPPGSKWTVDVIDTWNMVVETLPDAVDGRFRVPLPARPYMAIRLRRC